MGDLYLGQIILFAGNFAPRSTAFCNGQLLSIAQNTALFSILGTTYGGDGRTTFALPDLRGRAALHPGTGPGLTPRKLGQRTGFETDTLSISQMPQHNHTATLDNGSTSIKINTGDGTTNDPVGNFLAKGVTPAAGPLAANVANIYAPTSNSTMPGDLAGTPTIGMTGGNQPHNNMQPWLGLNYIICMQGLFPSRN